MVVSRIAWAVGKWPCVDTGVVKAVEALIEEAGVAVVGETAGDEESGSGSSVSPIIWSGEDDNWG